MPLGPELTDEVINLITKVYLEDREQKTEAIHAEVKERLKEINPQAKPGWPGLSAVQKELAKIRKKYKISPPWSMATLREYPLPPSAIPDVLSIYTLRHYRKEKPLTIREAWWVAHLSEIIKTTKVLDRLEVLYRWAMRYAIKQELSELSNTPFDTSDLDRLIGLSAEGYVYYPLISEYIQKKHGFIVAAALTDYLISLRAQKKLNETQKKLLNKYELLEGQWSELSRNQLSMMLELQKLPGFESGTTPQELKAKLEQYLKDDEQLLEERVEKLLDRALRLMEGSHERPDNQEKE